uniref:Uncharacterized protein n=1 Tax=Aliivibrio wodanis TaxID=80852 RepID=A0A5Q4ZY97_9GAMM|nr:hypothetical protein [Aliivibrio wodanis]VVV06839.1 hypothetical protein AW0309160_04333 [Aliivibrio wodanis]
MKISKNGYEKLFKEFLNGGDTSAQSRKIFVKKHKLNDNTFRSKLAAWKKTNAYENWACQQTKSRSIKNEVVDNVTLLSKTAQISPGTVKIDRDARGRFIVGNTASELHGKHKAAFKKKMFDNDDEEALAECSLLDSVRVMQNQLNILNEVSSRRLREITALYATDKRITHNDTELTEFEAIQCVVSQTQKSSDSLLLRIATTQKQILEIDALAAKRPLLDLSAQTQLVTTLVLRIEEEKLDNRKACQLFLKNGLTPPVYFQKLAELEAKNAEDEIDDEKGLTVEEAEELRETSIIRRSEREERQRKLVERNNKIYEKVGNLGRESYTFSDDAIEEKEREEKNDK